MSIEERFQSAVNVIRGLPKNGSYQPSIEMMLRFYGFFKQATDGPCVSKKPLKIWLEQRAKWDAWNKLGNMPREIAMENYVEELKKIVETMSLTDSVADFMGSLNELGNINVEDLELVAPEIIRDAKSRPSVPAQTIPISSSGKSKLNGFVHHNGDILTNGHRHDGLTNGHNVFDSDDEFYDSVEDKNENRLIINENFSRSRVAHRHAPPNSTSTIRSGFSDSSTTLSVHLLNIIEQMERDLQQITNRLNIVERSVSDVKKITNNNQQLQASKKYPTWWPFQDISPQWFIFVVVWPLIVNRIFAARRK